MTAAAHAADAAPLPGSSPRQGGGAAAPEPCDLCPVPVVPCRRRGCWCRGWRHADGWHIGGPRVADFHLAAPVRLDLLAADGGPDYETQRERTADL